MIVIKSISEIAVMREAGRITALALNLAEESIRPGISTAAINRLIEDFIVKQGATPSFKNYNGFPSGACISLNSTVVHGIPSSKVLLCEGDIVSIDVGAYYKGFHGDAARTFAVGQISDEAKRLIEVTEQSFFKGLEFAVEGNRLGDVSSVIQSHVEQAGFSVVRSFVGHGIGRSLHESPDVPNFGEAGRGVRLRNGMCIAIEPMVNLGGFDVSILNDGWTTVTKDGSLSAHYENTVAITEQGPKILTDAEVSFL